MAAVRRDSLVGLAALAYMSGVHGRVRLGSSLSRLWNPASRLVSRECIVGLLFSAGCILPVLRPVHTSFSGLLRVLASPAAGFAALAWLNVRAIVRWESDNCNQTGSGKSRSGYILAGVCTCGALAVFADQPRSAALLAAAAISAVLLAQLDANRHRVEPVTLRAAADLVLLTPLLVVR